jgi:hypothetical protein
VTRFRFAFSAKTAAAVLAIWTLVGLFRGADRYFSDPFHRHRLEFGLSEALAQCLLSAYLWAALTPAVVALAKRCMPSRRRWAAPTGALLVAGAAAPLFHGMAFELAYPLLMGFPCVVEKQIGALAEMLPSSYLTEFATFWAIVGATWTVTYAHLSRERAVRASQLKTRLARARLETLKSQLHPHFLFNALHSILPLVFRDADAASRTVRRLSDLLRLSLQNEAYDLLPLSREIEILSVYLEIQRTRFADRLAVSIDVPGAGRVEVRARRERDGRLALVVTDDGPGPSAGERPEGGGVGLRNTRERLALLYGDDHEFAFEGAPGHGCRVRLSLPFVASDPSVPSGALPEGASIAAGAVAVA